jgi:hypothetical protein
MMATRPPDDPAQRARIERELRDFFASYARAFDQLDGDAVAAHFCVPSMLSTNAGFVAWTRREQVGENMRALCEHYRRGGFVTARWRLLETVVQPPAHVFANVLWTVDRGATSASGSFRTSYALRRDEQGWRVLLCTAHEEQQGAPAPEL